MKLWLILSIASYSILECFPGAITEFSDSEVSVSIFICIVLLESATLNYLHLNVLF